VRPESVTRLYWSIRGEVACAAHAPEPQEPQWFIEGWQPLPPSSPNIKTGRYQCQHCARDGRAIAHRASALPH
jgi:hypothetical protein